MGDADGEDGGRKSADFFRFFFYYYFLNRGRLLTVRMGGAGAVFRPSLAAQVRVQRP